MHNQDSRLELADLKARDGTLLTAPKEKADLLNNFFSSVFTQEAYDHMPTFPDRNYDEPALDVSFTVADMEKLRTPRPNKSPGVNGLNPQSSM